MATAKDQSQTSPAREPVAPEPQVVTNLRSWDGTQVQDRHGTPEEHDDDAHQREHRRGDVGRPVPPRRINWWEPLA